MTIAVVAANVRPINPFPGCVIGDVAANATITAGDLLYHDGTGWAVGAVTNATTGRVVAVALVGGASGEKISVLCRGRLTGWTGLTAGARLFSGADGVIAASASNASEVGFAISTTDWYFTGSIGAPVA
jgi:hypothetical protein